MGHKIIVTDCDHGYLDPERRVAAERAVELVFADGDRDRIDAELATADALLTQYVNVTEELLERAPECRVIGRYGVGIDNIDHDAAGRRSIRIVNVPDFCYQEVADHAMVLALDGLRRITAQDRVWKRDPSGFAERWHERFDLLAATRRLSTLTFGVVGFGRTGQAVAKRALPFGFRVCAYDPLIPDEQFEALGVTRLALADLVRESDVISLHAPANADTESLIDAAAIATMKKDVVLVNTARGALVDEDALLAGLQDGKIGMAALDAVRVEPLPADHPFLRDDRVLLTPHVAFFSRESVEQLKESAITNVIDALEAR